ncbi:hypothetical protein ABEI05_08620 [Erwinia billingiae]|uniref:hypothetical protein n=1 Tax=Erwinia billingiae TaxID=182337 RepID=UPI0032094C1B
MNKRGSQHIIRSRLAEMKGGWFVGAFSPAAFNTADVEVAVQHFAAGYQGDAHHHKLATEVTLLLSGEAHMADEHLLAGDIITLVPGVSAAFTALTDCITVVVKHPGVLNDKYLDEVP